MELTKPSTLTFSQDIDEAIKELESMAINTSALNNEKILIVDNIIKRIKNDFIIDDEFSLLNLIQDYGLDFILNDLSLFIRDSFKDKKWKSVKL